MPPKANKNNRKYLRNNFRKLPIMKKINKLPNLWCRVTIICFWESFSSPLWLYLINCQKLITNLINLTNNTLKLIFSITGFWMKITCLYWISYIFNSIKEVLKKWLLITFTIVKQLILKFYPKCLIFASNRIWERPLLN